MRSASSTNVTGCSWPKILLVPIVYVHWYTSKWECTHSTLNQAPRLPHQLLNSCFLTSHQAPGYGKQGKRDWFCQCEPSLAGSLTMVISFTVPMWLLATVACGQQGMSAIIIMWPLLLRYKVSRPNLIGECKSVPSNNQWVLCFELDVLWLSWETSSLIWHTVFTSITV